MSTKRSSQPHLGWLGWAGADAFARLALLSGATIIFARLLEPEAFGISAIVLATSAAASLLVGAPFQDALAQRRVLRTVHLRSVLGFSLIVSSLLVAFSIPLGAWMAASYAAPDMALLLPVAMLSIVFSGHVDLVTAKARRQKRFNDVAASSLLAHLIAVPLSVGLALFGAGIWSLVALRLVTTMAQAIMLQWRVSFPLRPALSMPHLRELGRMAGIASIDRLTDNLNYLLINNLVGTFFGLAVLGHVNIALRLIEPLRGAAIAALHNLSFPTFRRAALYPDAGGDRNHLIVLLAATITPIFAGLAAVTPVLLPLVTGPEWQDAIAIAVCLALGAALALPAQTIFTALTAGQAAEYALLGNLARLVTTTLILVLFRDSPPIAVGLARLAGDGAYAALALAAPLSGRNWPRRERLFMLLPSWTISGLMAATSTAALFWLQPLGDLLALVGAVILGIALQFVLMAWLQRDVLRELLASALPGFGATKRPAGQETRPVP